jgi:hypothetical protein
MMMVRDEEISNLGFLLLVPSLALLNDLDAWPHHHSPINPKQLPIHPTNTYITSLTDHVWRNAREHQALLGFVPCPVFPLRGSRLGDLCADTVHVDSIGSSHPVLAQQIAKRFEPLHALMVEEALEAHALLALSFPTIPEYTLLMLACSSFKICCDSFRLGVPLAAVSISKNAAGESQVKMLESVREFDVYIINTGCGEINTAYVPSHSLFCQTCSRRNGTGGNLPVEARERIVIQPLTGPLLDFSPLVVIHALPVG